MKKQATTGRSPRSRSRRKQARRCSSCTTSIPRKKHSTKPFPPAARVGTTRHSTNSRSFSPPRARAQDSHDVVDLAAVTFQRGRKSLASNASGFCYPDRRGGDVGASTVHELVIRGGT